ncbi:zinc finger (ccch type) motif-containing protein [Phytophthora cinnamomi]|uniref:zinc finger (ccch type) motif-containing protein n=1 Tax=Phytophthora cinnamomi TaxID=4785 RepID=UPI00355A22CE|nr:zinc finger (ccch type) motif-containing protein [Phytophthora cinnamomi]
MAAAAGSPAEPQHEPAPVDAASEEGEDAVAAQTEQQLTTPDTGELLDRVANEITQAFQSSLVQVVSDIGREYGVEPGAKFAWMEKGGAVPLLHGKEDGDGDSELGDDVRRILRELQASRLQVRELQQVVDELRDEQRLSKQRMALFGTLSSKLKRELVDERLALIDAKNEISELRRRRSGDDTGSGGGRSPQSPSLQEQNDNPWTSPNKPLASSGSGAGGSGATGGTSTSTNLMAFNFYSSASARGEGEQEGGDEDEPPSPSSSTQTLRSQLMGQFLPSSLLDSPQVTPKHAKPFPGDNLGEDKVPPPMPELKDEMESLSLTALPAPEGATSSTVEQTKAESASNEPKETSQSESGRLSTSGGPASTSSRSVVSPLQLSMLSELFDSIPVEELESILLRFDGQDSAAIDHILHTHPSFNPAIGGGVRVESGGSLTSMASPSPSRSSSVGHGKTSLHRTSSQSGPSGPPPGSSSNWKTEICMYYMQGKCNKTRRTCSFAHGESDLVRPSASSGSSSSSKHGPNYKTRLCQAYENGTCTKSRRDCPMAHGVNDLRDGGSGSGGSGGSQQILPAATPRLQSYKTELCYYFLKGNCNYTKDECRFAHGQSDLRTVESNTAQIAAAAAAASGFGGDYPTSPVPPPPAASMEKQLQLQHQYQQQYQQHSQPPSIPQQHHAFQPQPPPAQQQQSFVPQHQLQLQHSSRGAGSHQFGFQHQQYDMAQQQQNPYMQPPGQFRYLKSMDDKRSTSVGRPPRRDSGSSWSSFDASGLPPSEY